MLVGLALCGLLLAGCGSSSPASTESDAIARLQTALSTYNRATPRNVRATGDACGTALVDLKAASLLANPVGTGSDRQVREDLHAAYISARSGFSDCSAGARAMSYIIMARADTEIAAANRYLRKAREGD